MARRKKSAATKTYLKHILGGNMPLLKVDSITGGYGDSEILRQLSMSVDAGEIVSIIGPNGAGKYTLMNTVFGMLHPRQGSITFDGHDISQLPAPQTVKLGMCYGPPVANVFLTHQVERSEEHTSEPPSLMSISYSVSL